MDEPVFAEHKHLPRKRLDARFMDHKEKKVISVDHFMDP